MADHRSEGTKSRIEVLENSECDTESLDANKNNRGASSLSRRVVVSAVISYWKIAAVFVLLLVSHRCAVRFWTITWSDTNSYYRMGRLYRPSRLLCSGRTESA